MSYTIGISSGFWQIGKDPNLLGLAQKAGGFGATGGIQFNQIDLETVAEFLEPRLKENIKRVRKELGVRIGIHAEIGSLASMESAERRIWEQAHIRIIETVKYAKELGIEYVNVHTSSTPTVQFEEAQKRTFGYQYQVVAPDGKAFPEVFDKLSASAKRKALDLAGMSNHYSIDKNLRKDYQKRMIEKYDNLTKEDLENYQKSDEFKAILIQIEEDGRKFGLIDNDLNRYINERKHAILEQKFGEFYRERKNQLERILELPDDNDLIDLWRKSVFGQYFLEAGEIGAYLIVGHDLHGRNDSLWTNIVGSMDPDDAYSRKPLEFNAAIAARYLQGHLEVKDHEFNKKHLNGMSIKEWVERHNIVFVFELPEVESAGGGTIEGLYRFFNPLHIYYFIKKMGSPSIKQCIDFEHMLAQKLNPEEEIKKYPGDFGKHIYLFHLGEPKPYFGKAHIPIPMGSQAQEVLYKWLFWMRKKGFENGILLFERGGGRSGGSKSSYDVFENSVWVLKQIGKYLEKDVEPEELPPEFFGLAEQNKEFWARQIVTMRDHAWDPLEGVLSIPEEKHTFLSRAAVEKGKREEWEKRRYR